jgi:hypothetical protein
MQSVLANLIFLIIAGYGPVALFVTLFLASANVVALHFKVISGGGGGGAAGVVSEEVLPEVVLVPDD